MKKKMFPLKGIMTIRKYKELIARKLLVKAKQPLVKLNIKMKNLVQQQSRLFSDVSLLKNSTDTSSEDTKEKQVINTSQLIYNLTSLSSYSRVINALKEKRNTIKKEIEPIQQQYVVAKNKLETMQIVHKKFEYKETKRLYKKQMDELQEIMLC